MGIDLWEKDYLAIGDRGHDPLGDVERIARHGEGGPGYIGPRSMVAPEHRGITSLEGDLPFAKAASILGQEGFPGAPGRRGLAVASQRIIGRDNPGIGVEIWGEREKPGRPSDGKGGRP